MLAAAAVGCWFLIRRAWVNGFDSEAFLATLRHADWRWLVAAWVLAIASYYGRVLRWMVMLRPIAPAARVADIFAATAIGFSAVVLLGRPGEFVRPYLIARAAQVPVASQLAAWLLERIYDTLIVLAIFGYALAAVVQSGQKVGPTLHWVLQTGGWFTGITCTLCMAVLIGLQRYSDRLEDRLRGALTILKEHHQERLLPVLAAAMDGLRSTRSAKSMALLYGYSALEWFIIYLCYHALFLAFPATTQLGVTSTLVYIGFVAFGGFVQIPGIGGGFQIVAVLVLTEFFHIGMEQATGIALVTWAITLIGIMPLGVILAFREGLSWGKLREVEREASI
ncbi:lysylphosphatidylglycerol synthase transmembrane domain-containing protein [uncultured Paludibaculum sp.]|uniref:lysylphosphatidylglycerol synthase transmembrane domain-containing protein n=1 Tax=uncultured Paludibaculum sp. TaxID=1765020 RepID=UPI00374D5054